MAFRTWAKLLTATLGVGALAGASQLGMAYGLGIVRLTRVLDVTTRDQWTAQLAWVAWFPMVAAVVGAVAGAMLLRRWSPETPEPGVGTELALAFAAAIGAAVVVPLTMQPARTAQVAGVDPVVVIAICAGLGALVGVFAAWAALAQTVARWSFAVMGVAVWVVALVSVAPSLAPSDPLPAVRLGAFDAGFLAPAVTQRTALATMPALALLIGAALGWLARRRELSTVTIALAGLPGPALLTIAYLIAGPGAGDDRYQVVPYWAAMTATGAGVLGSVLAAVLRRGPGPDDESESPEDHPPLPQRTGKPESAIAAAGAEPATPDDDPDPSSAARPSQADAPQAGWSSAGLGGPPPAKPRRRGRRSSMADAFSGRTGELPATTRPTAGGEYATPPFDTFARGAQNPSLSSGAPWSPTPEPARPASHAAPEPQPYVPEPATRPIPPEALPAHTAEQPRTAGGRLGRSMRPFARGRAAEPLTPEPTAISAPLPHPNPITPPLPLVPAPREAATDEASDGRRKSKRPKDDDYVDWVSGLGK